MRKPNSYDPQEFDRLSQRIDDLMEPNKAPAADDGIDLAQYTPADISDADNTVYQNFPTATVPSPGSRSPAGSPRSIMNTGTTAESPSPPRRPGRPLRPAGKAAAGAAASAAPRCCCF